MDNGDVIASGYAKDLIRRLHAIMEAVNSAAGGV
jgi:hypothetical protein